MKEMHETPDNSTNRRRFIKTAAAVSALSTVKIPHVFGQEGAGSDVRVALIGCGGRGTGAAENALSVSNAAVKIVAMADVFQSRLNQSLRGLQRAFRDMPQKVDVPRERRYIGFEAYKQAMDELRPGDIAIFATPLAFRWVHFTYAIEKGLNVFMEKPLTADGPTTARIIQLAEQADAKNLKVGVGLMSRHSRALQELHSRVQDGEIGDIVAMRAYRMHGPVGSAFSEKWPGDPSELLWQIQHFHSFIWASGGCYNDFYIHVIDHCCWMKNAWPVKAQALGGRHYRTSPEGKLWVDQNFDSYSVEYTFADGAKLLLDGRCMLGCNQIYSSYLHGTKGFAIASKSGDCGLPSSIYTGQDAVRSNQVWESEVPRDQRNPYQNEWNALVDAIINDKPHNEAKRGAEASLVSSMGRKAAHTGQEITFEDMLNSEQEYAPDVDKLTMDSPAPVRADADGLYPVPMPGINKDVEYKVEA